LTSWLASRYCGNVSKSGAASIDTPYPSVDDVAEGLEISRTRARRAATSFKTLLDDYERSLIRAALEATSDNRNRAALKLCLLPTTLHEKMKRLGLLSLRRPTLLEETEEIR